MSRRARCAALALVALLLVAPCVTGSPSTVRMTLKSRYDLIRYCLWEELARVGTSPERFDLVVNIDATGSLDVVADGVASDSLRLCFSSALNGVRVLGWTAGKERTLKIPIQVQRRNEGKLALDAIQRILKRGRRDLRTCAKGAPSFVQKGTLVVDKRGFVRAVWQELTPVVPNGRAFARRLVARCLSHRLRGLRFPAPQPSGYVRVAFEFQFRTHHRDHTAPPQHEPKSPPPKGKTKSQSVKPRPPQKTKP